MLLQVILKRLEQLRHLLQFRYKFKSGQPIC